MVIFKKNTVFKTLVVLVMISFTGCVTSKIEYVESSKVPVEKTYRISQIYLKDGTIIDVKEKEAKLRPKYKGVSNVIVYYEDVNMEKAVLLKNVSRLKIEVLESNVLVNVLIIAVSVVITVLIAFWISLGLGGWEMH